MGGAEAEFGGQRANAARPPGIWSAPVHKQVLPVLHAQGQEVSHSPPGPQFPLLGPTPQA